MRRAVSIALALFLLPASAAEAKSVKVMTRNLYLGADIFRPVDATKGKDGLDALVAFGNANAITRTIVDQTSFPARSKLLAAEIKASKPDLVGLQEVSTWRSGPFDLARIGTPTATTVDYDFLKTLTAALKKAKAPYQVVRTQKEADVEGPVFEGSDFSQATAARLSIRDVILKRKGSKVKVLKTGSANYKARYEISLSGVKFTFLRGYTWADAKLGRKRFRFVQTHFESADSTITRTDAQELLAGPANIKGRPVIVVCDCNSDPEDTDLDSGSERSAYQVLTGQAPYAVPGGLRRLFDTGSAGSTTFGFDELVKTPTFDRRIDYVFTRSAKGKPLKVLSSAIVGKTATTAGGLHASDHAGVVAKLRL